jgi:hypothetical protein
MLKAYSWLWLLFQEQLMREWWGCAAHRSRVVLAAGGWRCKQHVGVLLACWRCFTRDRLQAHLAQPAAAAAGTASRQTMLSNGTTNAFFFQWYNCC